MSDNLPRSRRFRDLVTAPEAFDFSTRDHEYRVSVYQNAPKGPESSENRQRESEVDTTQDLEYASGLSHRSPSGVFRLSPDVHLRPSRLLQDLRPNRKFRSISAFAVKIIASLHPYSSGAIQDRKWALSIIGWTLRVFSCSLQTEGRYPMRSPELKASDFVRYQSFTIAKQVADRLDSTPSFLVTDELDPTQKIENHDGGSKADNRTENEEDKLLRILEDFTGSKSFDWLVRRIQAFAFSSRCMSLLTLSTDLSHTLTEYPSRMESPGTLFSVDADLKTYLRGSSDGGSSLRSIICVNADGEQYEATTLGEYMARMWPMTGVRFLDILQEWIEFAEDGENNHQFDRGFTSGKVSMTSSNSCLSIHVEGPMYLCLEVGEQLAWLGCIGRMANLPNEVTSVRPVLRCVSHSREANLGPTPLNAHASILFEITFKATHTDYQRPLESILGTCWRKLFRNICVADGFPVNTRCGKRPGLELPFDMMAQLSGAHRATLWNGQLAIKGFETLFVPVMKTDACIFWHLVTKPNHRRVSYNAAEDFEGICEQSVHIADLINYRHVLGWVPKASQHAGTEDGNYDQSSDVYLDPPGRGLILSGVSLTMSKIVGMGGTFTLSPAQRGIRTSNPKEFFAEVVDKMTKIHVLLYDHKCARGWLLDGASALLHILRFHVASYKPIQDSGTFDLTQFCYADSRIGSDAAKDVLLNPKAQDIVLLVERSRREKETIEQDDVDRTLKTIIETDVKNCLLKDRILDMWDVLEQMYDRWKGKRDQNGVALEGFGTKLEGWKFQDVVDREHSINPVVAELDDSAKDWIRLIRRIDAVVLFGNGFGELMRPMGEHCVNWTSVPQKKFCLAVPIPQLRRIARKHGRPDVTPIKLTENVYWHITEHPFECECRTHRVKKRRACDRSQALQYTTMQLSKSVMGGEILSAADHDNGAVIFGGRKLHKSLGQPGDFEAGEIIEQAICAIQQSGRRGQDHAGTSLMRKMRKFLSKKL